MRALTRGERNASVGVVAGLVGLICLLAASLGLNLKHAKDLDDIKQVLVGRCQARQASDERVREDLQGRIDLYAAIVSTEQANRFIDEPLRARRIVPYRKAMAAAQAALTAIPAPVDCTRVYAAR
jgi:hypothetical protein